jgi:hypothetical protein
MELWEQADEYFARAMKTMDKNKRIELLDIAISLGLQAAKQAGTEKNWLILIGNTRFAEANKYVTLASKLGEMAKTSYGSESARYLREAASYQLSAYSSRKEGAEIDKEQGDIASYHNTIGLAYKDQAFYHYYLAGASKAVDNWNEAFSGYKVSLSLLETALKHFNYSLRMEFHQDVENNRKRCFEDLEWCISNIREAEPKTTGIKTTGTPMLSVSVSADNLRQNTYSPVMLKIVNDGDGVAREVKIRLDAPVEGETTASLETMKQNYETQLALSVKPFEHGRIKFKVYAEYKDIQGKKDTAIGGAWMHVAQLTEQPAAQQVFHITNFTGDITKIKEIAGGDIVQGTKSTSQDIVGGDKVEAGAAKISDSVVQRSEIGKGAKGEEKPFTRCPYCGEALNLPKTPKFCPHCGEPLR